MMFRTLSLGRLLAAHFLVRRAAARRRGRIAHQARRAVCLGGSNGIIARVLATKLGARQPGGHRREQGWRGETIGTDLWPSRHRMAIPSCSFRRRSPPMRQRQTTPLRSPEGPATL